MLSASWSRTMASSPFASPVQFSKHFRTVRHPSRRLPQGIPFPVIAAQLALVHHDALDPGHAHEFPHDFLTPRGCPRGVFVKEVPSPTNLLQVQVKTEHQVREHAPLLPCHDVLISFAIVDVLPLRVSRAGGASNKHLRLLRPHSVHRDSPMLRDGEVPSIRQVHSETRKNIELGQQ